ncbi:hypothetical protein [uncultured Oscillibacter sp.]|uniref:hypothetical protein n=1 Tax=uncultured Oscillibacter sp. TaxID=876091 RepID=UPI0025F28AF5|nr:hypothetical protein [uncultured Oscillibacter sp.]
MEERKTATAPAGGRSWGDAPQEDTLQTRDVKALLAGKIESGEPVALYCYGILASHMLCCLEEFYGVLPAVIIDNDERKRGTAEFGVPVMPFADARERFGRLQYFICSDDFKYTIIGDLLEEGVRPEDIVNYVPVERRRTCLYFYNRLLLVQGREDGPHSIAHCNKDSFKPQTASTRFPCGDGRYEDVGQILDRSFEEFERGEIECCRDCVMNKEQYIVSRGYPRHYKSVAFYQETCADCLSHCVYCCVEGGAKRSKPVSLRPLEDFSKFAASVLALGRVDDDLTCAIDVSEREHGRKVGTALKVLEEAGSTPLVYKINSCLLVYEEELAGLLRQGKVYVIWSLDAGTRETYRKIKQIDAFDKAVDNVRRYIEEDVFGGRFIVAKYLIVKGINDDPDEFDAYLRVVKGLGLRFVSLSFDYNVEADEQDLAFIRDCYRKLVREGLQITYKNDSAAVTKALSMNSILEQSIGQGGTE